MMRCPPADAIGRGACFPRRRRSCIAAVTAVTYCSLSCSSLPLPGDARPGRA
jgi:hypothetical protein